MQIYMLWLSGILNIKNLNSDFTHFYHGLPVIKSMHLMFSNDLIPDTSNRQITVFFFENTDYLRILIIEVTGPCIVRVELQ